MKRELKKGIVIIEECGKHPKSFSIKAVIEGKLTQKKMVALSLQYGTNPCFECGDGTFKSIIFERTNIIKNPFGKL